MALTINTNLGSLIVQKDLDTATKALHKALEKAEFEHKVEKKTEDKTNYAISDKLSTQLNSISVTQDNIAIGSSMLSTMDNSLKNISNNLEKIKNLIESDDSDKVEKAKEYLAEIDKIAESTEFNNKKLINGTASEMKLQIAISNTESSKLVMSSEMFASAKSEALLGGSILNAIVNKDNSEIINKINSAFEKIDQRQSTINEIHIKLDMAADSLEVQYANISSSLSTIRDADVVAESSDDIKSKILEQASASLESTANQVPSIAINLL